MSETEKLKTRKRKKKFKKRTTASSHSELSLKSDDASNIQVHTFILKIKQVCTYMYVNRVCMYTIHANLCKFLNPKKLGK